ncbi:hypothetical protein ON010_g17875 [Phytophthora cinnamomi]|nr:hypothetical protein ON010_g17875 [Phytophthora cinnamomi]
MSLAVEATAISTRHHASTTGPETRRSTRSSSAGPETRRSIRITGRPRAPRRDPVLPVASPDGPVLQRDPRREKPTLMSLT